MKNEGFKLKKENIVIYSYYILIAISSLGIFYWFNNISDKEIKLLLDFYKGVVEIFFSNYHYFNEELGYYVGSNYIIGENCLGLNIIVLIFGICSFVNIEKLKGHKRILWILFSGLMAVVVGVFANILRLLSSIYFTSFAKFELIHAMLGIVTYLAALFICYEFSTKIIKNKDRGENIEEHI